MVRVKGGDTLLKLAGTSRLTNRGIRQAGYKSGKGLIGRLNKDILKTPKSGRTYIIRDRSGRRRRHVASAPGETHANMSGRMRRSAGFKIQGTTDLEFGYGVSSREEAPEHAKFVVLGTSKMRPRPSLKNAFNAERGSMITHFEREIAKEIKAGIK